MRKVEEQVHKKRIEEGKQDVFVGPGHGVAGEEELQEYPGNMGNSKSHAFGPVGYKESSRNRGIEKVSDEYINKIEREIERLVEIAYGHEASKEVKKKAFEDIEELFELLESSKKGGKRKKQRKSKKNLRRNKRKSNKRKTK